jgi:hypothetical protein
VSAIIEGVGTVDRIVEKRWIRNVPAQTATAEGLLVEAFDLCRLSLGGLGWYKCGEQRRC